MYNSPQFCLGYLSFRCAQIPIRCFDILHLDAFWCLRPKRLRSWELPINQTISRDRARPDATGTGVESGQGVIWTQRIHWYFPAKEFGWWFGTFGLFFHSVGRSSSSQLTFSPSFFRGVGSTTNQEWIYWDHPKEIAELIGALHSFTI